MATVKQIIEKAYTKVNGEYEVIAESSDDFKTYLNVLNFIMESLAHMPYVKWQIFFDMEYDLPDPVASGVLSYTIPDLNSMAIGNSPYDHVFFINDDGDVVDRYKLIDVAKFQGTDKEKACAIAGDKIYFKKLGDDLVGTKIRLPIYKDPEPYTSANQTVIIDNVPWLVTEMSASICDASPVPFIARNADKYYKQSAVFMKEMRENNRRTQTLIVKSLESNEPRTWQDALRLMTIQDL